MNTKVEFLKRVALTVLLIFSFGCANYSKEVRKTLERTYQTDFPSYDFRETPIGNFGVGTIFKAEVSKKNIGASNVEKEWLVAHPNTWYLDNLSEEKKTELNQKIFEEGSLGSVRLEENISTKLKLETAIPSIKQALEVETKFNYEKGVKVKLKASEAVNRQMNWSEFINVIKSGHLKKYVGDTVKRGDFVICAKDIVLEGYTVEIEVDSDINPGLYAKLNDTVGKTFGIGSSFTISVNRTKSDTFEVKSIDPVIAAIMYKRPPYNLALLVDETKMSSVEDWNNVTVSHAVQLWAEGKVWMPELIPFKASMCAYLEPQTIDFKYKDAKFSIPAKEAASVIMRLTSGKVNVKADPKIVLLTSQLSQNELMKKYVQCLASHYGYSYEQMMYIDKFIEFMVTKPTVGKLDSWQEKYPFPRK